jgi:hypothetical protein
LIRDFGKAHRALPISVALRAGTGDLRSNQGAPNQAVIFKKNVSLCALPPVLGNSGGTKFSLQVAAWYRLPRRFLYFFDDATH